MTAIGTRSGVILLDKPKGITSHDAVAKTRKAAGTRKVGHAGTLDPMATGLLVLGLNSSTRLLTYVVGLDKEYYATIALGASTSTDDAEGEIVTTADASALPDLEPYLDALRGPISQVPSSVSAIKVDGKRAYARVRAGETVELTSRSVTIAALEVLDYRPGVIAELDVRVECSSGTYIRAIARDLGDALGVGGHLTALRRTRIGPFGIGDAATIDQLDPSVAMIGPVDVAARLFPVLDLEPQQAIDLSHGKRLEVDREDGGPVAAVTADGRLAGLVTITKGRARPLVNFPTDEYVVRT